MEKRARLDGQRRSVELKRGELEREKHLVAHLVTGRRSAIAAADGGTLYPSILDGSGCVAQPLGSPAAQV